jgi:hypothetical protein
VKLIFVHLRVFTKDFFALGLDDGDLRALEAQLLFRPDAGSLIQGAGGTRKVRFAPPSWNRGKSGSTRICYAYFPESRAVYFLAIYTKHDADNLSAADKASYRRILESYRRWLKAHPGELP